MIDLVLDKRSGLHTKWGGRLSSTVIVTWCCFVFKVAVLKYLKTKEKLKGINAIICAFFSKNLHSVYRQKSSKTIKILLGIL